MNSKNNYFLSDEEEVNFINQKFDGINGGKIHIYSNCINFLANIRFFIFIMAFVTFLFIFIDWFRLDSVSNIPVRLGAISIFILSGIIFNKNRILSILLSTLPLIYLVYLLSTDLSFFNVRFAGLTIAYIIVTLCGIHYHSKARRLEKEIKDSLLENQLVGDNI